MGSKIKISERKASGSIFEPRFTLALDQKGSNTEKRHYSYEVLSRLIGSSDVIVGLDSSLQSLPSTEREPYTQKFLESIRELGLEYRCNKIASNASQSILSFIFGGRNQQAQEVIAFVPNEIWVTEAFEKIIPVYGARYFITKGEEDGLKLLGDLQKMLDDEKGKYFKMIAFSSVMLNSMGIISNTLTLDDLKKTLDVIE